jgi:hypothetical protein
MNVFFSTFIAPVKRQLGSNNEAFSCHEDLGHGQDAGNQ